MTGRERVEHIVQSSLLMGAIQKKERSRQKRGAERGRWRSTLKKRKKKRGASRKIGVNSDSNLPPPPPQFHITRFTHFYRDLLGFYGVQHLLCLDGMNEKSRYSTLYEEILKKCGGNQTATTIPLLNHWIDWFHRDLLNFYRVHHPFRLIIDLLGRFKELTRFPSLSKGIESLWFHNGVCRFSI